MVYRHPSSTKKGAEWTVIKEAWWKGHGNVRRRVAETGSRDLEDSRS